MLDGLLCGQGKLDRFNNAVFFYRKNSGKFRENNLSKFVRVTNSQKMASVNNIFQWLMKFWSPQSCSTGENFTARNLSTSELGKHICMLEVSLTVRRTSENFASCFPDYRYQAPADHWGNVRDQLFSCNVQGRCQPREINFSWMCCHSFNLWDFSQHPKQHSDPPTQWVSDTVCCKVCFQVGAIKRH